MSYDTAKHILDALEPTIAFFPVLLHNRSIVNAYYKNNSTYSYINMSSEHWHESKKDQTFSTFLNLNFKEIIIMTESIGC